MRVHIALAPEGQALGLYVDGKLVAQKQGMKIDDVLTALGIRNDLIVFDDEEMKAGLILPASVDAIPILGLLGEGATIAGIEGQAQPDMNTLEGCAKEIRRLANETWEVGKKLEPNGFELGDMVKMAADDLHDTARRIEGEIERRAGGRQP